MPGGDLVAQGQVRRATETLSGVLHGKDVSFLLKVIHKPLLLRELETTLSDRGQETQVTLSGSRHFTGQAGRRKPPRACPSTCRATADWSTLQEPERTSLNAKKRSREKRKKFAVGGPLEEMGASLGRPCLLQRGERQLCSCQWRLHRGKHWPKFPGVLKETGSVNLGERLT